MIIIIINININIDNNNDDDGNNNNNNNNNNYNYNYNYNYNNNYYYYYYYYYSASSSSSSCFCCCCHYYYYDDDDNDYYDDDDDGDNHRTKRTKQNSKKRGLEESHPEPAEPLRLEGTRTWWVAKLDHSSTVSSWGCWPRELSKYQSNDFLMCKYQKIKWSNDTVSPENHIRCAGHVIISIPKGSVQRFPFDSFHARRAAWSMPSKFWRRFHKTMGDDIGLFRGPVVPILSNRITWGAPGPPMRFNFACPKWKDSQFVLPGTGGKIWKMHPHGFWSKYI